MTSLAAAMLTLSAAKAKTLGIVALLANDALNIAVITGATEAAKAAGWDVKVIDTQASADQANAAMNSRRQGVDAIFVLAFASELDRLGPRGRERGHIPVATWGGEIVPGIVVTTSGLQVGETSVKYLLDKVGDVPAEVLAITFHPGKLCIDRGVAFERASGQGRHQRHLSEVMVPGQVQHGNATARPG